MVIEDDVGALETGNVTVLDTPMQQAIPEQSKNNTTPIAEMVAESKSELVRNMVADIPENVERRSISKNPTAGDANIEESVPSAGAQNLKPA